MVHLWAASRRGPSGAGLSHADDRALGAMLYPHIAAGFTGFVVAPAALAVRKGGVAHRRWGLVFSGQWWWRALPRCYWPGSSSRWCR
ncbi:MAG: hypothetical protein WKG07_01590 [Hymenobacter sp.]